MNFKFWGEKLYWKGEQYAAKTMVKFAEASGLRVWPHHARYLIATFKLMEIQTKIAKQQFEKFGEVYGNGTD